MWRMTMTSTMPVVITAMVEVWTVRIQRLREVRNEPPKRPPLPGGVMPLMMSKPTQITASAAIMPSMRVSISVARRNRVMTPSSLCAGPPRVRHVVTAYSPGRSLRPQCERLGPRPAVSCNVARKKAAPPVSGRRGNVV